MKFSLVFILSLFILSVNGARRPKPTTIIKPIRLKEGQAPVQEPGWKHCLTYMKARFNWISLKSPGYPKFAGTQLQCSWIIEAPIGYQVKIMFKDLNMAKSNGDVCRQQYVEIIDETLKSSQGRFCGTKAPGDYVSKGTLLRIDLQGDKSKKIYKGFSLQYKFVKELPGFRPRVKQPGSATGGASGKVNLNSFKSAQQKAINNAPSDFKRPTNTGPIRYASDIRRSQNSLPSTVQPNSDSGWVGGNPVDDDYQPLVTSTIRRKSTTTSNRIAANVQKSPKPTFKDTGGKITAAPANKKSNDGWVDSNNQDSMNNVPSSNGGIYYGQQNQPSLNHQLPPMESNTQKSSGNYVVVHQGGLSTTNLVIIVAAVFICILFVVGLLAFRYFYRKRILNKSENNQSNEANPDTISNRNTTLPGVSDTLSHHGDPRSRQSISSFHNPDLIHSQISRTHSLSGQHYPNIYANNQTTTLPPRYNPHFMPNGSPAYKRPLPPLPKQGLQQKCDIDEDYCSGSEDGDGVVTLKREFSKWEINSQKKKRFSRM